MLPGFLLPPLSVVLRCTTPILCQQTILDQERFLLQCFIYSRTVGLSLLAQMIVQLCVVSLLLSSVFCFFVFVLVSCTCNFFSGDHYCSVASLNRKKYFFLANLSLNVSLQHMQFQLSSLSVLPHGNGLASAVFLPCKPWLLLSLFVMSTIYLSL